MEGLSGLSTKLILPPFFQYLFDEEDDMRKKKHRHKLTSAASITRAHVSIQSIRLSVSVALGLPAAVLVNLFDIYVFL